MLYGLCSFLVSSFASTLRFNIYLLYLSLFNLRTGTCMIQCLNMRGLLNTCKGSSSSVSKASQLITFVQVGILNLPSLSYIYWPLLGPVVGFLVFVYKNNGQIVLGDQEHHSGSTFHPAMLLHQVAAIFVCVFPLQTLGYLLPHGNANPSNSREQTKQSFRFKLTRLMKSLLDIVFSYRFLNAWIVCGFIMEYGVLTHPFMLADNRHYMFYVWRRVLSKVYIRRMLAPMYAFMTLYTWDTMVLQKGFLWSLVFAAALLITLLPAHLTVHRFLAIISSSPH